MLDSFCIGTAVHRLAGVAVHTSVLESDALNEAAGARVHAKAENLQRTASFKFRGAYNALSDLSERGVTGVVTYSSGNHGGAVAHAAQLLGMHAVVLMPKDAPQAKVDAVLRCQAELRTYDRYRDDRHALASSVADETGAFLLASSGHAEILAGAATAVLELLRSEELDVLLLPVGGGGLLAGAVLAARESGSAVSLIAVEPEGCDAFGQSLRRGEHLTVPVGPTLADGLQLAAVTPLAWSVIEDEVREAVTVSDEEIRIAVGFLAEHLKVVVEPSGAAGIAAILTGKCDLQGQRVGTVLTGGNVGNQRLAALLA